MNKGKIAENISFICKSQNLKISALLKKAGLSPNVFDDWQNEKTEPSFPALFEICRALNIDIAELFSTHSLSLTDSQLKLLAEWKHLSDPEKQAVFDYISAMRSNHK